MKMGFKSLVSMLIIVMVFGMSFNSISAATTVQPEKSYDEQVQEIAEQLEFVFEEATIEDSQGNITGIDFDKIETEYGTSSELQQLKEQLANQSLFVEKPNLTANKLIMKPIQDSGTVTIQSAAVDRCVNKKLKSYFGSFLGPAALALLMNYIWDDNYTAAAKQLIKMGVKGNVWAVAAQLPIILTTCIYQEEGW